MTTFVDPLGITVQSKTGIIALSSNSTTPVEIPRDCGWMVAAITPTENNSRAVLSDNAEVGDIVELYVLDVSYTGFRVNAPTGETVNGGSSAGVSVGVGRWFRKITATSWAAIGPSDGNP